MRVLCIIFMLLVTGFCVKGRMKDSVKVELAGHFINRDITIYGSIYKVTYNPSTRICVVRFGDPKGGNAMAVVHENGNKSYIDRLMTQEGDIIYVKGLIQKRANQLVINVDNVKSQIGFIEAILTDPPAASPLPSGETIETKDAAKHLGELVNLWDTVYAYTGPKDNVSLLCVGKAYPNQLIIAAVKDQKDTFDVSRFVGKRTCLRGTIVQKDGKYILLMNDSDDILNHL